MEPLSIEFTPKNVNAGNDIVSALSYLPSPTIFEYYKDENQRTIWLEGVIDLEEDTLSVIRRIARWNLEDIGIPKKDRKPILLFIYSYGGDAELCRALIDAIAASKTPIYGINLGICCSSAAYVFISCHKRFAFSKSSFLFHKGSATFEGSAEELEEHFRSYQKQIDDLGEIIKKYTKYTKKEIKENLSKEWYVYADEALKNGVCDKIIESFDDIVAKQ